MTANPESETASASVFKRAQVEAALWRFLGQQRPGVAPPPVFRTRIKRLLDVDRASDGDSDGPQAALYAFADALPGTRGQDVAYSAFDVFCLGIGLDLLDIGFKQAEVVFLLRHIRTKLARHYRDVMRNPPAPRQITAAEDRPGCPSYVHNGMRVADCRVYMVITKLELREAFATPAIEKSGNPIILQPVFCHGREQLHGELAQLNYSQRKVLVMEIAEMAVMLHEFLKGAPLTRRGRP